MFAGVLHGRKVIAVSNREPYVHTRREGRIECLQPAGGMTASIDPIMSASGGVWVAHGSGNADREVVDRRNRIRVPPGKASYTLRRVWLPPEMESDYYCGFANQGLWPLCHAAFQRPQFRRKYWEAYHGANRIFANAVLDEAAGEDAVVLIQDYHLALLPRMLKDANPRLTVTQFWHIPWPHADTFEVFPWKEELLEGMLGNDLIGFHLPSHCSNFLSAVERSVPAVVDDSSIDSGTHRTVVRPFPIGIDFEEHTRWASGGAADTAIARWRAEIGTPDIVGIGIDRIDYTKGIPERLAAIDMLLEEHPEYLGRLVFVQVAVPSRSGIAEYRSLGDDLARQVALINARWGTREWKPIHYLPRHFSQQELVGLHLVADFCVVSSLDDGMNLVAKEFVASRVDGDGVLVLSEFAGAARELGDALIVNPFACDEIADAIDAGITMEPAERRRRMLRMREAVASNTVFHWAGEFLTAAAEAAERSRYRGERAAAVRVA